MKSKIETEPKITDMRIDWAEGHAPKESEPSEEMVKLEEKYQLDVDSFTDAGEFISLFNAQCPERNSGILLMHNQHNLPSTIAVGNPINIMIALSEFILNSDPELFDRVHESNKRATPNPIRMYELGDGENP